MKRIIKRVECGLVEIPLTYLLDDSGENLSADYKDLINANRILLEQVKALEINKIERYVLALSIAGASMREIAGMVQLGYKQVRNMLRGVKRK